MNKTRLVALHSAASEQDCIFLFMRATVIVLLLAFSFADAAQAQQQLTLACKGTVSSPLVQDDKPDPVSMGILVDFATRRVLGFGMPGLLDYPIMI